MTATMTLTDPDRSIAGLTELWSDSEDTAPIADECANTEAAWLINHTHEYLSGWSFNGDGSFSGPPIDGAHGVILGLFVEAGDFVLANLDEVAELAAEG